MTTTILVIVALAAGWIARTAYLELRRRFRDRRGRDRATDVAELELGVAETRAEVLRARQAADLLLGDAATRGGPRPDRPDRQAMDRAPAHARDLDAGAVGDDHRRPRRGVTPLGVTFGDVLGDEPLVDPARNLGEVLAGGHDAPAAPLTLESLQETFRRLEEARPQVIANAAQADDVAEALVVGNGPLAPMPRVVLSEHVPPGTIYVMPAEVELELLAGERESRMRHPSWPGRAIDVMPANPELLEAIRDRFANLTAEPLESVPVDDETSLAHDAMVHELAEAPPWPPCCAAHDRGGRGLLDPCDTWHPRDRRHTR